MPDRLKLNQTRFPLLDRNAQLVGWSDEPPFFRRTTLRHPEAEELIGTPVVIVPALLMVNAHMRLAAGAENGDGMWVLAIAHADCIRHMPIVLREEKRDGCVHPPLAGEGA
jgi:hypothetical protein